MFRRSTRRSKLFPTIGLRIITEPSSPEDLPDLEAESYLTNSAHHRTSFENSKHFRGKFLLANLF